MTLTKPISKSVAKRLAIQKPKKKAKKKKSLSALKKQAWDLLSRVIRTESAAKDGYCQCYTCGKMLEFKDAQAGHAIGGRHNAVLFDEEILRCQCMACNVFKRGNYQVFITRLIEENGFDWWLTKLAQLRETIKYNRCDLESKIDLYKARLKEIE